MGEKKGAYIGQLLFLSELIHAFIVVLEEQQEQLARLPLVCLRFYFYSTCRLTLMHHVCNLTTNHSCPPFLPMYSF